MWFFPKAFFKVRVFIYEKIVYSYLSLCEATASLKLVLSG